jgi:hypothetical protein
MIKYKKFTLAYNPHVKELSVSLYKTQGKWFLKLKTEKAIHVWSTEPID